MMAYREGAPAAGLPFPRKSLGVFTGITIAVAASAILPLPFLASPAGWMMFKNGGTGMYVLVLLAFLSAAALGLLGAFTVRGKSSTAAMITAVPALPILAGVIFYRFSLGRGISAVMGESVDPSQAMRILAEATSEADSLLVFGCGIGACAFGAAAVALLGATASVDRTRGAAPAGAGWILSLVIGATGVVVAFGLRIVMRAVFAPMLLTIPSMILGTGLACLAARNGPHARGWHDGREAKTWIASLLAAAIAAAAGVALLDAVGLFLAESQGLGAIAGESVDHSQKARILAEVASETRAATLYACVDAFFAFATVAAGLVSAIGRGPDRSARSPLAPPAFVALASTILVAAGLLGVRAWTFHAVSETPESRMYPDQKKRTPMNANDDKHGSGVELPRVGDVSLDDAGDLSGPTVVVQADGTQRLEGTLGPFDRTVVLRADGHATWAKVAPAVSAMLLNRSRTDLLGGRHGGPTLSIRVATSGAARPFDLGRYQVFLSPPAPALVVALDRATVIASETTAIDPKPTDDMNAVVAAIAHANAQPGGTFRANHVLLVSPNGTW